MFLPLQWVQFLGGKDPLEKGMATQSSILAWRSLGQRSLAGYSPWGRKMLDMTEQLTHTHTHTPVEYGQELWTEFS